MNLTDITYTDKVMMDDDPSIPVVNKVTDNDLNEIKNTINANNQELEQINNYIIEQGGSWNTNYYAKYSDGTLVQWGEVTFTDPLTTGINGWYRTANDQTKNLVQNFTSNAYSLTLTGVGGTVNFAYISNKSASSFRYFPIVSWNVTSTATKYVQFIAMGRWKE